MPTVQVTKMASHLIVAVKFETTTGVYTDIMQTGTSVLDTTWSLIDPASMILKLDGYTELTAN